MPSSVEDVWRRESVHVLSALLRRHPDLADCEDAAQEALIAAADQWGRLGVPDNPRAWLIRVASRRVVDQQRSRYARERRERTDAIGRRVEEDVEPGLPAAAEDSLLLLLMCCHPALSRPSQVALTLQAVGGLSSNEIAAAYLVPVTTMSQRLSRARATLRQSGARFGRPEPDELPERVAAVLDVCHLMFNEGYTRTSGDDLLGAELAEEAIRLTRLLHQALPDHDEVAGALALMLLTHARAVARTDEAGDLVPLRDQDRGRWDRYLIAEGANLLEQTLLHGHVGRFQVQAAIAAVHSAAPTWEQTDWIQICLLYAMLHDLAPGPAVTLNRAVALGMAYGPERGLALVDELLADPAMARYHRTYAVQAHLLQSAGRTREAAVAFAQAARLTASRPEQRYLNGQLLRLS